MVGRTQSKGGNNKSKDASDSITSAENGYLKIKNQELAKALAQSKSDFTQLLAERDYLQRELLSANLQIKKLERCIDVIDESAKSTLHKIVSCSDDLTKTLQTVHVAKKIAKKLESDLKDVSEGNILQTSMDCKVGKEGSLTVQNYSSNSPTNHSKTHAVKPMVSGHVIFRPIISLRRVNEEEIERSMNTGAHRNPEQVNNSLVTEDAVAQETEDQNDTTFRCHSTSYVSSHLSSRNLSDDISEAEDEDVPTITNETEREGQVSNDRLHTLQEEDEISDQSNHSELPSQRNKDMMIGLITGVKLFTYNSAQNVSSSRRSNLTHNGEGSSQIPEEPHTSGRMPLVTTHRGTRECVSYGNLEQSPSRNSCSIENESKLLSRNASDSSSQPSTSGLQFPISHHKPNDTSQVENSPRNTSTIISATKSFKRFSMNGNATSPNVLLENLDASEISKIQQLSILGLEPKLLKDNTSTPLSPVVRTKRLGRKIKIEQSTSKTTPEASLDTTPKRRNTKSIRSKKQAIIGNPTVILKRLTMPKRSSKSPVKRRGSRTSSRFSKDSNESESSENYTNRSTENENLSGKRLRSSREETPKRRKLSKNQSKRSEIPLMSPQRLTDSPIRPRRRPQLKSFKEPSLRKKMRRSK